MDLLQPIEIPYDILDNIEQITSEFLNDNIDNYNLYNNMLRLITIYYKNNDVKNLINSNVLYFEKILMNIFNEYAEYSYKTQIYYKLIQLKKIFDPIIFKVTYLKIFLKYKLDIEFLENLNLELSEYNNYKLLNKL